MSEDAVSMSSSGSAAGRGNNRRRNNNNNNNNRKSKSPKRQHQHQHQNESKSRSPNRRQGNKSRSPTRNSNSNCTMVGKLHKRKKPVTDMTVIVNRCDLWDSAAHFQPEENQHPVHPTPDVQVAPYHFAPDCVEGANAKPKPPDFHSVTVARVPHTFQKYNFEPELQANESEFENNGAQMIAQAQAQANAHHCGVVDTSIPNPHRPDVVHDKYWAQRRRLFSRFDRGIQLDSEGWYSVTPEIIADHVAHRVADLAASFPKENDNEGIVILDAFCGCGGNSIAFGKIPSHIISKVVCVDTDRSKLLKAAHNASLYGIPKDKLIFVECNSSFILQYCYKDGHFVLDQPTSTMPKHMPAPVQSTNYAGYQVGGLDMLPRRIDAVFMDPPWGGVDYEVLGKNGYDLQKNMKIQVGPAIDEYEADGDGVGDDFFDTFSTPSHNTHTNNMSQKARKANFNKKTEGNFIDGMELLRVAAAASSSRLVVYDLPRNTSKMSLGKCGLGAGYRGNVKLEEHYLNGRLKTVTAYMGADCSSLINDSLPLPLPEPTPTPPTVTVPDQES